MAKIVRDTSFQSLAKIVRNKVEIFKSTTAASSSSRLLGLLYNLKMEFEEKQSFRNFYIFQISSSDLTDVISTWLADWLPLNEG